jgi:dipeptidyl aminopeptidase/acylaminoacyl peptidase
MKIAVSLVCLLAAPLAAETVYQKPPREILEVLNAPAPPAASVNPPRTHMLLLERRLYPSIADLAAPVHRIAGLRINPANNGPHNPLAVFTAMSLLEIATGKQVKLATPAGAKFDMPVWSPDGTRFAALNHTAASLELYVGSVNPAALRRVAGVRVNGTLGQAVAWMPGGKELLVRLVPAGRGPAPRPPTAPAGPNVQESAGRAGPVRTFQDMLKSPYDESLFEYFCTSQLAFIDFSSGAAAPIGKPVLAGPASPAPDGRHLLVTSIRTPYSYLHPYMAFPREVAVWDRTGKVLHVVHRAPLEDKVPIEGVPAGPRNVAWRPTEPATLTWWEALDGGDPRVKAPHRDKLMMLKAPFKGDPAEVAKTVHRARGLTHGEGGMAMVSDFDRNRRWVTVTRIFLDDRQAEPKTIFSRSVQDRYGDPGQPAMKPLPTGGWVIHQQGDSIFLTGPGATPKGDRPFLRRLNLRTGETEEIFRAGEDGYEPVEALLAGDGSKFLTSFETPTTPPNFYVRTRGSEERKALTNFTDPAPQLRQIKRQLVTYKRDDGVQLSFTLFLPPGYKEGTRLPTLLWAYPLEYTDAGTAGQIGGSTQRFVTMRGASHLFLLLAGYAILNDATIPIVGDPETVNDTYVEQLVASARAAIGKAVEMGVADRDRVGVSGHSYGGFMTANLLAHSDLFRAGVARSGAYNRTLTPFGFQSERRTFWEARDVYMKMSPFTWADKINEPLLLIHGEADNNAGTFPVQSERLYQAVRGHGGTVRLVMLPHESHGYAAKESIEHAIFEMVSWFDRYVKNAPPVASRR